MPETWYILDDGTPADPNEVSPDEAGMLKHKDGGAVKMRSPGVPMTRSVDPEQERAKSRRGGSQRAEQPALDVDRRSRDMRPDRSGLNYRTR